ncbi:serine protease Do [Bathymodiolus platifrons methanotrophic gill symbiont]|uniref:S1C family serine protease n=1 Tax=Bathymodiolus platifrons methanotrophic gill symbiont TaxID=113268 RepID=UPI001B749AE8|nr:serine protease [Bathymodiolus platifrons methanotrophic gill symbiont]GFO74230.1 serine protease Do [Bathymodiolus platifrons methanotrophic gill symbiont]
MKFTKKTLFLLISFSFLINAQAQELSETLLKVKPGVVGVGTFLPSRSPRSIFLGTGFVIGNGQLIVTNAHVVAKKINTDRLEKWAIVDKVAVDRKHDIAILKLKRGRLPTLTLGSVSNVKEGGLYTFTGYPIGMVLGLYPVTHRGIISAISPIVIPVFNSGQLNAKLIRRLENPYNVYQLDATAYPGNSGSPLYDVQTGEVIGVINKVFVKETKENVLSKPIGITYAIPIVHVKNLLASKGW